MARSMRMLSSKMRNFKMLKNDIFNQHHGTFTVDEAIGGVLFIKKVSLIVLKNSQENNLAGVFFY